MVRFGRFFKNTINVNLDRYSTIKNSFETLNYKGFYGIINAMSFSNKNGKPLVLYSYTGEAEPTLLLFYNGTQSLYLIIIDSKQPFDMSIINILNLI